MKQTRVRTESMVQKLSKQPIEEGYALLDKHYFLGAMRLLTVKAESLPPFKLGPCLETIADILVELGEREDAAENYGFACEKFDLISQPVLANINRAKALAQTQGLPAAIALMNDVITSHDADGKILSLPDGKPKEVLARAYLLRAELKRQAEILDDATINDAQTAAAVTFDRCFAAHLCLGRIMAATGDKAAALASFSQAIALNNNCLDALDEVIELLADKPDQWLATIDKIIALHPRSNDIKGKAFKLSELGRDGEALAMLDNYIAHPPQEESSGAGTYVSPAETKAAFCKAKAAIFADQAKWAEAKAACEQALDLVPEDQEATAMLADITEAAAAPPAA